MMKSFEHYLIMIGIRNMDYGYPGHSDHELFNGVPHFKKCFQSGMSAYKALLYLGEYLNGDYE